MILDRIVGAAGEEASDGGPLVAVEGVCPDDRGVLCRSERLVLHVGAELVTPPQPARLAGAAGDAGADEGPVARAVLGHQLDESGVLLWAPRPLHSVHGERIRITGSVVRVNLNGGTRRRRNGVGELKREMEVDEFFNRL